MGSTEMGSRGHWSVNSRRPRSSSSPAQVRVWRKREHTGEATNRWESRSILTATACSFWHEVTKHCRIACMHSFCVQARSWMDFFVPHWQILTAAAFVCSEIGLGMHILSYSLTSCRATHKIPSRTHALLAQPRPNLFWVHNPTSSQFALAPGLSTIEFTIQISMYQSRESWMPSYLHIVSLCPWEEYF